MVRRGVAGRKTVAVHVAAACMQHSTSCQPAAAGKDRAAREAMFAQLSDQLSAAPIQHIGKLLILWRPQPEKIKEADEDRKAGPRDFKILKYSSRGGQRPEVKTVRVLGNQRLAAGGQIKRAKPKQKSIKKGRLD